MIEEQTPYFRSAVLAQKRLHFKLLVMFLGDMNLCYDLSPTFCLGSRSFN